MRNDSTLYVGLDVHKDSIAVAYAGDATVGPWSSSTPAPDRQQAEFLFSQRRLIRGLSRYESLTPKVPSSGTFPTDSTIKLSGRRRRSAEATS